MKKLLFVLFLLYSIFSFAQPDPAYGTITWFTTTSNIATGVTTITYVDKGTIGCDDHLTSEYIEYRIGSSGSWSRIYTAANNSFGSGVTGTQRLYTGGNYIYRELIITNLPGIFYSQSSQIRLRGNYDEINVSGSACGGEPTQVVDIINTINNSIDPVDNLTATDGSDCDEVKVYFTRPAAYNSLPSGTSISYKIERSLRSSTSKDLLDGNDGTINYFDPTAAPGVLYKYYITPILTYANGRKAYGDVGITNGSRFGIPGNASGLFLDQVNCSGNIKVEWNWSNSTNPDNFIVERSNTNSFSSGVTTIPVSGSDRSTRDAGTSIGSTYFYRVSAQDNCPNSATKKAKSAPTATEEVIGLGIPDSATISTISLDTAAREVTITWADNSNMEEGFKIVRQGGTQTSWDVSEDVTSYIDKSAQTCEPYTYQVLTYNSCRRSGVPSTNSKNVKIPLDITTTFDATHKIEATDGEYGDRIDLQWNPSNRQNEDWSIVRINATTGVSTPLPSVDGKSKTYSDYTADANTLYKYKIEGIVDCDGDLDTSNFSENIGFRLAYGTINGQITYSGASSTAVPGVKVIAEAASGSNGKSGVFNGTSSYAAVPNHSSLESDSLTVVAYINPSDLNGVQTIATKHSGTVGWRLYLDDTALKFDIGSSTFTSKDTIFNLSDTLVSDSIIKIGSWSSVSVTVDEDSIKLFINGVATLLESNSINLSAFNNSDSLLIGSNRTDYFNGNIDEVRVYNRAITKLELKQSYDVFINPSMDGLIGYWRFDEGFGQTAYDYSKTNLSSNRNHSELNNVLFSNTIPSATQLSSGAYTDKNGSYFIPFVPYLGTGDNFTVSPSFGIHKFSPPNTTLYIGGASPNYSSINFLDSSNFTVKGSVKYKNTSCFESDVFVLVDGVIQQKVGGSPITTDVDGKFEVSVPIGVHEVRVQRQGHKFDVGSVVLDFQDHVTLDPFTDSTLMTVIGRVAGGGIQATLPPGLHGKNNIGITKIVFEEQGGCLVDSVTTSSDKGLYKIKLPPLQYNIPRFSATNNSANKFEREASLDLIIFKPLTTHLDSTFDVNPADTSIIPADTAITITPADTIITPADTTIIPADTIVLSRDTSIYHFKRDFILFNTPSLNLQGENFDNKFDNDFIEYSDKNTPKFNIPIDSLKMPYPLFEENKKYTWQISAFEVYENKDGTSPELDSVPYSNGSIKIVNNLAGVVGNEFKIESGDDFDGYYEYSFNAGQANTATASPPEDSYTKTFTMTLDPSRGAVPYSIDGQGTVFKGVIFGGRSLGNSFATSGPQVVTMILRDPPGSNSYSTWEKNTSVTTRYSFSNVLGGAVNLENELKTGLRFTTGLGYSTTTAIKASVKNKLTSRTEVNDNNEIVETTTRGVSVSTGSDRNSVGPNADVFIAKAMNVEFGLAELITLIDSARCIGCNGQTFRYNNRAFKIGKRNAMTVIPGGFDTEVFKTQKGIEDNDIPDLESLRNQLLALDPRYDEIITDLTDPNYGKSNDDPVFGASASPDPLINSFNDSTGLSYTFKGYTKLDTMINGVTMSFLLGVDSVWWYNRQIQLWKDAIARNERAKVQADLTLPFNLQNNTFDGGPKITATRSTTRDTTETTVVNFNITKELLFIQGAVIAGGGAINTQSLKIDYTHIEDNSTTNSTQTTFSYTFDEPDISNKLSIDVYNPIDGFGPIFKTRGGKTSCPYEEADVTKYFRPGTVINAATVQLEEPQLTVVGNPVLDNVPADVAAIFNIKLANLGLEGVVFDLRVMESSNPNGAEITIDGIYPNRPFIVPPSTPIYKQLSIKKGATHIKYDSLALILHSQCQYDIGTIGSENIADTMYISANFLPSCTDIDISNPDDLFVMNATYNNVLPVEISNYDINYGGLNKIQLEYRPTSQSAWIPLGYEWHRDSTEIDSLLLLNDDVSKLKLIPTNQASIDFNFSFNGLPDQNYQMRASSTCNIPGALPVKEYSEVISGIVDRVYPQPFGVTSPGDGILDPNDNVSIRFNEPIDAGRLTLDNFQLTGVVNSTQLSYDKTISFDGISDYMEIGNGFDFASESFTVEFWAKRASIGSNQVIISQGNTSNNAFSVGFNTSNQLELQLADKSYTSNFAITDVLKWHHYTLTYDKINTTVEFTNRVEAITEVSTSNNFFANYSGAGKTYLGKNAVGNTNYFNGSMFQLRIWNQALSASVVNARTSRSLSGREAGLVGYWPMDEGRGPIARDVARFRHADMFANWELNPKSSSLSLNGTTDYAVYDSAQYVAITQGMDMTIEFWFKTLGGSKMTFLSNGSGLEVPGDLNRNGWNIELEANNTILVKNDGYEFEAVSTNYANNNWHHFALVVNRLANTTAFIDGVQQNTVSSDSLYGFGAERLAIGARLLQNGTVFTYDQYFQGNIDEVRVWNSARLRGNIELDQYNRLTGNEFGLLIYFPFETFNRVLGVPVLTPSLKEGTPRAIDLVVNGTSLSAESAAIALPRQVKNVSYSWVVNNDKIVFNLNESPSRIENVTLNVSVKNIEDLQGNKMQSPKTWIAYVNKNQVIWQDIQKNMTKEFNDTLTFTATIANSGGELKNFNVSSLPSWLTASRTNGSINPLSSETIKFTVNQAVNIGNYSEDIILSTDFGFDEKLLINLKVSKTPPAFAFDPNLYQNSMSIIGQIRINGGISYQADDKIVALINGQVRGVANLQYISAYDSYMAFLDVYSNTTDSIDFQVWNSSKGELHIDVQPRLQFASNGLVGSPSSPQFFDAKDNISKPVILQPGWNWVSFPLNSDLFRNIPSFMSLNRTEGDLIKTRGDSGTTQYGTQTGWLGDLNAKGIQAEKSYMVYVSATDTIDHRGLTLDPDTMPIAVNANWNRIGFISLKNLSINTALANYNAVNGDIIKSQQQFAYYDQNLGWIGSLQTMEPTEGYLLHASAASSFVYPRLGLLRTKSTKKPERLEDALPVQFSLNPNNFEESTVAIAELNGCDEIVSSEDFALAAFYKNELRGWSSKAEKLENDLGFRYFITAYGSSAEEFSFKIVNKN
ncbi:MAG: hypothetical protein ACJARP_003006, partial [Vicingaceae bacterium]